MTETITSTANPRIKSIRKLLSDRKERESTGLFVVEGLRLVIEALEKPSLIDTLVICPELLKSEVGKERLNPFQQEHPQQVINLSPEVFQTISQKDGPQGVAAVVHQNWSTLSQIPSVNPGLILALDEIADPGNLGTIIRTADAAGVTSVILLDHCTDPYDRTALRGSMGAVFSVSLIQSTFDDFLVWKDERALPMIGTSDKAKAGFHSIIYPDNLILLMGSERQGLEEKHFASCSNVVSIPMLGSSDSLNLAVATGVMLYEILNHQNTDSKRSVS